MNNSIIYSQDKGIIRGFVADSTSGEALPYANVFIKELNRGVQTDFRGYFIIAALPYKRLSVVASYIGYKSKEYFIMVEPFKVTDLKFFLPPVSIQMKTIEQVAQRIPKENATDLSLQKIGIREIENLPKGIELDIFRSLQNMPGVQTAGDVSAKFYVRGSASNENLVLLDDTPIYNPFHALGIFSSIDPDMVNSMEFYKGGFPSEYAGRLSSVVKVVSRDGNKNNFSGKASLSLLTAKLLLEGPIPNGSFILSGRKNYSDYVLKKFRNNNSIPADFHDLFFKANYSNNNFMKDAKWSFSIFSSKDKIMNNNPKREDFKWENNTMSLSYFQLSDTPLFYNVEVTVSNFIGERIPNSSGAKYVYNKITDGTMRLDFTYVYDSKDELSGGFRISEVHTRLVLENFRNQVNETLAHGANVSVFLKYKLLRWSSFGLDIGTRANATRLAGGGPAYFLEPRASLTYRFIPQIALKSSWGIYLQDLVTISDENEVVSVFEPWIITPLYLKPSSAIHYIGGFEITPNEFLTFNLEGYYKLQKNLAIINENKFFATDKDLIHGDGKSYGLEFLSKLTTNNLNFTTAYALMYSFKTVNGKTYSPRYDSRHNVNLTFEYNLGLGFSASAVLTYSSGLPFTQIAGYYDKLNVDDLTGREFLLDNYNPFIILGEKNLGRLPDYHRLDLSLTKKLNIGKFKITTDLSAINVYNRKNLFYFRRDTGERVNMLPFLPSASIKVEL
ncbi:MAG: TonB-dependent receptor [Melioribacteraceae bacterium]|nr:TonB-dependent receptor [Melioribacteraceae bacterium]